jgi:hypothetical protein
MKKNSLFVCCLFFSAYTMAQVKPIAFSDINGMPIIINKTDNLIGSPYLCDEWNKGNVTFKNGKKADSFKLRFDMETNALQFFHKEMTLVFVDPVQEFKFNYNEGATRKEAFFRSGYPETDKHSAATLYQVLAEGARIQLLQYSEKEGAERKVYNKPPVTEYMQTDYLYLYDTTTKKMHKIKCRKSSVIDALPALAASINKLCEANEWTLKNTEELKLLVAQLR